MSDINDDVRGLLLDKLEDALRCHGVDRSLIVGGHDIEGMTSAYARYQEHVERPYQAGWHEAATVLELVEDRDERASELADDLRAQIYQGDFFAAMLAVVPLAQVDVAVLVTPPWPWHDLWRALHELVHPPQEEVGHAEG